MDYEKSSSINRESSSSGLHLSMTSPDRTCRFYLRSIEQSGRTPDLEAYINQAAERDFITIDTAKDLNDFRQKYGEFIDSDLSLEERGTLRSYSGIDYKVINQILRGQWNYDELGEQTPEKIARAEAEIDTIDHIMRQVPPTDKDFVIFRGTNLESFSSYGVNSLDELDKLEGQFFLEKGYASTSLTHEGSFLDQEFDDTYRRKCNVEVKYLVPEGYRGVIGLLSDEVSYSPSQQEVLIRRGSLSYITDVKSEGDHAYLEMLLIPSNIYDPEGERAN